MDSQILEKNLSALKNYNFNLYLKIKDIPISDKFFIEQAKKRDIPTIYRKEGNDKIYMHSQYDPIKEAERFVKAQDLKKRLEVFIFGVGLGYHVDMFLEEKLESINIVEADPSLFKLLLASRDITPWMVDKRVVFVIGAGPIEAMNIIARRNQSRILWRPLLVYYDPITKFYSTEFKALVETVEEDIMQSRTMAATVLAVSLDTVRNSFLNLPYLIKKPGIEGWISAYRDYPVFCVSPGPSLKYSIDTLRKAKGKAPIVAVDTAMKPLLKAGIKPDFVIGMDFTPQNKRHYEGVSEKDMQEMVLIADADMYHEILPMWKGPLFVTYYKHFLSNYFRFKNNMTKGPTTSHMAFMFSFYLGGEPIILIGQDLSYPDIEEAYIDGVSYQRKISVIRDSRGQELLMKVDTNDPSKKTLSFMERVESVDGSTVVTEAIFMTFGRLFERIINTMGVFVVDAKMRGMKIKGTVNMPAEEAFEAYCARLKEIDVLRRAKVLQDFYVSGIDVQGIKKNIKLMEKKYRKLNKNSRLFFKKIERIYKKGLKKSHWTDKEIKRVNDMLDKLFNEHESEIKYCQVVAGMVTLLVKKYLTFEQEVSVKDRFEAILAFLEGMEKASEDVTDMYRESIALYRREGII